MTDTFEGINYAAPVDERKVVSLPFTDVKRISWVDSLDHRQGAIVENYPGNSEEGYADEEEDGISIQLTPETVSAADWSWTLYELEELWDELRWRARD